MGDNTLTAAKFDEVRQKRLRLLNNQLVAEKLAELLEFVWKHSGERDSRKSINPTELQITPELYEELRQCDEFVNILRALEIPDEDQIDIFETLDVDGSGTVDLEELIVGVNKMRGDARRSDVVGISLLVRAIQSKVDQMFDMLEAMQQGPSFLETTETKNQQVKAPIPQRCW